MSLKGFRVEGERNPVATKCKTTGLVSPPSSLPPPISCPYSSPLPRLEEGEQL